MSIDTIYNNVVRKLTDDGKIIKISQDMLKLSTNHERVQLVYNVIDKSVGFPYILDVHKSESVSIQYRNHGNRCFQKFQNYEAWQYYNLSLLHAPPNSECYVLALSNRSAILGSLKRYQECLSDIKLIFTMNYPEKIKDKLLKREDLCKKGLSNIQEKEEKHLADFVTLNGSRDEVYQCASNKIEVLYSEEMGHHVVAKENISVGEVVAEEHPYFTLVIKSQYLFSCTYCMSRSAYLLPCDFCCFTLYCSAECKDNAWNYYHKTECPLMATFLHLDFTKLELLALRTVLKARHDHKDWESLFETIEKAEELRNTEHHGQVKINNQWVYDSKHYASIHSLATNIDKRSISDIFQKAVTCAVFFYLLKQKTDFLVGSNDNETEKIIKCVMELLLVHDMTSPTNMHGITTCIENDEGKYVDEVNLGSAPYAFLSLINHSCAPNVVRYNKLESGLIKLIALRPIKKGMQLFDNYGQHHALQTRQTRHSSLKFQYKFTCFCEACINNWPTYLMLGPATLPPHLRTECNKLLSSNNISKLEKGDKNTAMKIFKPLCDLAESLDPYLPSKEACDCQETLKQCLAIFQGLVPYGYSKVIDWSAVPPSN